MSILNDLNLWMIIEIAVGLQFVFWGLNGFFMWIQPPDNGEAFNRIIGAMFEIRGFMIIVKAVQIIAGALLVSQFYAALGFLMLIPIAVGIFLLQIFHARNSMMVLIPLIIPFFIAAAMRLYPLLPYLR